MLEDKHWFWFKEIKRYFHMKNDPWLGELDFSQQGEQYFLTGKVVTFKQRDYIRESLTKRFDKEKVKLDLVVLENLKTGSEGKIKRFCSLWDSHQKETLVTQLFPNTIVRIIAPYQNYFFLQSPDLTLGWANKNCLEITSSSFTGFSIDIIEKQKIYSHKAEDVLSKAYDYLDIPYLKGGVTKKGIDCSGLVQRSFWEGTKLLLPRHSWDQKKYGKEVTLSNLKEADLLFLINKRRKTRHVGIWDKQKRVMIHAYQKLNRVLTWDLALVLKIYHLIQIRRLLKHDK